jgi:hypothetical protein
VPAPCAVITTFRHTAFDVLFRTAQPLLSAYLRLGRYTPEVIVSGLQLPGGPFSRSSLRLWIRDTDSNCMLFGFVLSRFSGAIVYCCRAHVTRLPHELGRGAPG